MAFKENLKAIRIQKGLTKQQLADLLEIGYSTYQNYENTKQEPKFELLVKISLALGVSVDLLLADTLPLQKQKTVFDTLPPTEAACFTPGGFIDRTPWLDLEMELCNKGGKLEEIHQNALNFAKQLYSICLVNKVLSANKGEQISIAELEWQDKLKDTKLFNEEK